MQLDHGRGLRTTEYTSSFSTISMSAGCDRRPLRPGYSVQSTDGRKLKPSTVQRVPGVVRPELRSLQTCDETHWRDQRGGA